MNEPCRLYKQAEEPNPLDSLKDCLEGYMFMNIYVCYAIIITLLILAVTIFLLVCLWLIPPTYGFFHW